MIKNDYNDIADENLDLVKIKKLIPKKITIINKRNNNIYFKINNNLRKNNSNPFVEKRKYKTSANKDRIRIVRSQESSNRNKRGITYINDDALNKVSSSSNYDIPARIHDINKLPSQAVFSDSTLKFDSTEPANLSNTKDKNGNKTKEKIEKNTNVNNKLNKNNSEVKASYDPKKINILHLFKKKIPKKKIKKHCLVPDYQIKQKRPSRNSYLRTNLSGLSKGSNTIHYTHSEKNYNSSRNNSGSNCRPINNTQVNNINLERIRELLGKRINQKAMDNFLARVKLKKFKINTPFQTISNLSSYRIKKSSKDITNNSISTLYNNKKNKFYNIESLTGRSKKIDKFFTINLEEKRKILLNNNNRYGINNDRFNKLHKIKTEILKKQKEKTLMKKKTSIKYNITNRKARQNNEIFVICNTYKNITKRKKSSSKSKNNINVSKRLALTSREFESIYKRAGRQSKSRELSTLKGQIVNTQVKSSSKIGVNKQIKKLKKSISNVNDFPSFITERGKYETILKNIKNKNTSYHIPSLRLFQNNIKKSKFKSKIKQNNSNFDTRPNKTDRIFKCDAPKMESKYNKRFKLSSITPKIQTTEIWLDQ